MDARTISQVQACGFDVYMRNASDTWMLFTDGKNIGYLQEDRTGHLSLSTVHVPNKTSGTGFGIDAPTTDPLTRDDLARAFAHYPAWADSRSRESVRKYRSIDDLRSRSSFDAAYQLVPA